MPLLWEAMKWGKKDKQILEDILNTTLNCFGSHRKCKPEYSKTVRALQSPTNANDSQSDTPLTSGNGSSDDVSFNLSTSSMSNSDY